MFPPPHSILSHPENDDTISANAPLSIRFPFLYLVRPYFLAALACYNAHSVIHKRRAIWSTPLDGALFIAPHSLFPFSPLGDSKGLKKRKDGGDSLSFPRIPCLSVSSVSFNDISMRNNEDPSGFAHTHLPKDIPYMTSTLAA